MRRPTAGRRLLPAATRAAVLVLLATATTVGLAACSEAAATGPSATPSTTSTGKTSGTTRDAPLAPPSSVVAPRAHEAAAVRVYVEGYDVPGLERAREGTTDEAVVEACPGGPAVKRAVGDTAYARGWVGPQGARAHVATITFPDLDAATEAVDPVLDAAADCADPGTAKGVTTKVTNGRRDVAEGMPLGRVDLTRTSSDATVHDYIGVVQVGNVLVRLTYTSPDAKVANEKGSTALALLARDVQGL